LHHFASDDQVVQGLSEGCTKPLIEGGPPFVSNAIYQPGLDSRAAWGTNGLGHGLVGAKALSGKGQDLCIVLIVFVHVRDFSTHPAKK
jgi:hypothetical protein